MKSLVVSIAAGTLLALASSGPSWAQANTISILQQGRENTLTVDQTNATGSTVGALTPGGRGTRTGLSLDESGRQRFEELTVDGETSEGPVFGTAEFRHATLDAAAPALQRGSGNEADVTITGLGGSVGLLQQNVPGSAGNDATIAVDGSGTALVGQFGAGNTADLQMAGGTFGAIIQEGSENGATLFLGSGQSGSIRQIGDGNASVLDVGSFGGVTTNVDLIVQGNGLQSPGDGVSVVTNAQSVTITQTSFLP